MEESSVKEERELRRQVLDMIEDRFSVEEIVIGLGIQRSEVQRIVLSDRRQREQRARLAERLEREGISA